jgi:hypothetical protein
MKLILFEILYHLKLKILFLIEIQPLWNLYLIKLKILFRSIAKPCLNFLF